MKLSQNSTNVVVWEWMNEFGRWRPYAPHVTQFIENSYMTGSHNQQINLGSADTSLSSYAVDFVTTCQIRLGTGTARPIRRSTYPQSCPAGKGVVWQWEGDMQGQWHMYEMDIACVLEDSLSQNPKMPLLDLSKSTLKIPYHIDFSRMIQIRIETGRVRKIRRVSLKQAYPSGSNGVSTSSTVASSATAGSGANPSKRSSTSTHGIGPIKKIKSGFSQGVGGFAGNNNTNIAGGATHSSMTANPQQGTPHFSISNSHTNTTQLPPQSRRITRSLVSGQMGPGASQSFHPFQQNNAVSNIPHVSTIPQNSIIPQNPGMPQNSIIPQNPGVPQNSSIPQNPGVPQNSSIPQNPGMPQNMNYSSQHPLFPQAMSYMMNNGSLQNMGMGPSVSAPQGFMGMYPGHAGLPGGRGFIGGHNSINLPSQGSAFSHPVGGRRSGSQHLDIPEEDRVPNTAPKQNKKGKMSDTEMFEQFTEVIQHPPPEEDCCICCEKLCQASGYGEGQMENHVVYQMNKCSHMFHKLCLIAMYESGSKNGSMQCPTCKTIYGEKHGNCPKGMMEYSTMSQSLPGYPDCQTIRIMYHVSPGVQTQEHPHPGKRFSCRGFPRVCFLPDNDSGRKILKLLIVAWKRRLTFTIGQSTTTGESDTVTWNEIHHKTEFGSNVSGHGFPDDKYFDNVLQELAVQGVTEKDI